MQFKKVLTSHARMIPLRNGPSDGRILKSWRYIKYGDFSNIVIKPRRSTTKKLKTAPKSKIDPDGVPFVIPNITAHWLRPSFATMLYMAGIDVLTAKEQLSHADIKTTLDIYTYLDGAYKQKSMDKLDAYLQQNNEVKEATAN